MPVLNRLCPATLTGLSFVVLAACTEAPDSKQEFERFVERAADRFGTSDTSTDTGDTSTDGSGDTDCEPAPFDAVGTYLLGVNVFPLDRNDERPLLFETEVTAEADGQFTFSFQPLSTDEVIAVDGTRTPRENPRQPVGAPVIVPDIAISEAGGFALTIADIRVVGDANPHTGRDILADINLEQAAFRDSNFACGNVTGTVREPIVLSLAPSQFAMGRLGPDGVSATTAVARKCEQGDRVPAPDPICPE
jgi:hypothetical protein